MWKFKGNRFTEKVYTGKPERRSKDQESYISGIIKGEETFNKKLEMLSENKVSTYELANKDFLLNKGIEFAYQDINLEGIEKASEEYRTLKLFLRGYEIGLRRIKVEGAKHYNSGLPLEEARLKDHLAFIEGYNSCLKQEKGHKHR